MRERIPMPRILQGTIFVIVIGICAFLLRLVMGYQVLYVTASELQLRYAPSPTAPRIHGLIKGDRLFFRGESADQEGYRWWKVVYIFRPKGALLDDVREGWVPVQSLADQKRLVSRELGFMARNVAIRNLLKLRIRTKISTWMRSVPFIVSLSHHFRYPPDKVLHVLIMMMFSSVLFLTFLPVLRSKWATLISTFLTSNAIGVLNEVLDQWSGKGDFELKDVLANGIGSFIILFIFFIGWSFLEAVCSCSISEPGALSRGETE